jgi:hypothetical protein
MAQIEYVGNAWSGYTVVADGEGIGFVRQCQSVGTWQSWGYPRPGVSPAPISGGHLTREAAVVPVITHVG